MLMMEALGDEVKGREDVGMGCGVDVWKNCVDSDIWVPRLEDTNRFIGKSEPIVDDGVGDVLLFPRRDCCNGIEHIVPHVARQPM